jgi:hypothetical protein
MGFPKNKEQARCSLAHRVRMNFRSRNFGCLSFEIIQTRSKQTQNVVLRASNISSYQATIATTQLRSAGNPKYYFHRECTELHLPCCHSRI